jgi:hypothetical protein
LQNVVKYRKYSLPKFSNFVYFCIEICMYICIQNLQTLQAIFSVFYNILQPNFAIIYFWYALSSCGDLFASRWILRGGVERCAPPLRSFCTSPENFCTSPERSWPRAYFSVQYWIKSVQYWVRKCAVLKFEVWNKFKLCIRCGEGAK